MPKHSNASVVKQAASADPVVQLCVVALLRVIARSPVNGPQMPAEVIKFLGSVARPEDLLASFGKVGQRKMVEQAMQAPDDEEVGTFDGDFDDSLTLLPKQTSLARATRHPVTPRSKLVAVIKSAASPAIKSLALTLLAQWETANSKEGQDWLCTNVQILQGLFGLSDVEATVAKLAFAFACVKGQDNVIAESIKELFYCRSERRQSMWRLSPAIGCAPEALSPVFNATAPLRSSGLLLYSELSGYDLDDVLLLSDMGQVFASEPFENAAAVRQRVLSPLVLSENNSLVFTHLELQQRDITALLDGSIKTGATGINVLFYGQTGTGKTEFAKKLACKLGVSCYEVGFTSAETGMDASRNDRLYFLKLASRLIPPEERAVILLDEAEDIFDSIGGEGGRGKSRRSVSKAWMNALLETMRIPTIWITNDIEIDTAHLRRFTYVTEFAVPPISVRREIVRLQTEGLAITDATITKLARNDALTPAMLGMAAQFVRLARPADAEVDAALIRHVQASQRALNIEPGGSVEEGETEFDPRFINLDSNISVESLVGALRRTGRAGLLFYGPPGSGKTQLANYLAQQLDREMIYRTGSDLLDKYVGGTEQKISKLFRSCDTEREIIFLDEAEGLLGSREGAQRSWEVTQVNEFLRQIEQFKGIFIAATNHIANLDAALMRRFAFRLGFKPLTFDQRVTILTSICGDSAQIDSRVLNCLKTLTDLTAGDFSNVSRRLHAFSDTICLQEFLVELEVEASLKPGSTSRKIGFT